MNAAHWHLVLNHLPIAGTIIGSIILAAGFILNNKVVKRTSLGVFIFSALAAIPAFLTGEGAEELVEKIPNINENVVELHEDLGKVFMSVVSILGVFSLIAFIVDWVNSKLTSLFYVLVFIIAIGASMFSGKVGTSGGEIRHPEIQNNVQQIMDGGQRLNRLRKDED